MSQTPACPDVPDADSADLEAWLFYRICEHDEGMSQHDNDEDRFDEKRDIIAELKARDILADRASRALPSTALAARPEEGWRTKPLEWDSYVEPPFTAYARTSFGTYRVQRGQRGSGWWWWFSGNMGDEGHSSEDEAKAAAQADYEARIRSALVAPSTPPTAGDGHD